MTSSSLFSSPAVCAVIAWLLASQFNRGNAFGSSMTIGRPTITTTTTTLSRAVLDQSTSRSSSLWAIQQEETTTLHSTQKKKQLTDRQLQFWEDVDAGLDEIEAFYDQQGGGGGLSIDRVRQFAQTARGATPPPATGVLPGHEPSEEHVFGLTAQPFWDTTTSPDLFPWAAQLEDNADIIQKEFEAKLMQADQFASDSAWQNQVMGTGWSAIRLQRLGVWNTDNCREFQQTYQLLRSLDIPLAVRGVCFAKQAPQSGVQPHSDGRNFILTSHLGLKVPEGCWIEVGGQRRGWHEGKLTTLDTSFRHSTGNPTAEDRHVLILDFWHPELTEAECAALEFVYDLRNKFESGQIPFRKPRVVKKERNNEEGGGGGLGSWWKSVTGGQ